MHIVQFFISFKILKQLLSIFFVSLLLLLQYSRQVAYLHCKAMNILSAKHCDCETQFAGSLSAQAETPFTATVMPVVPDEFFTAVVYETGPKNSVSLSNKPAGFIMSFYRYRTAGSLLRPPQA